VQEAKAVNSWTYRCAVEMLALATSRGGDTAGAVSLITAIDTALAFLPAPSAIEHSESMLRRAQLFKAAGMHAKSLATAKRALADLAVQHQSSPRLRLAKALSREFAENPR
jgi:hypothetical protein